MKIPLAPVNANFIVMKEAYDGMRTITKGEEKRYREIY
jgi:hypothetical protein